MLIPVKGLLPIAVLALIACAPIKRPETGPGMVSETGPGQTAAQERPPRWRPAGELIAEDVGSNADAEIGLDYRLDGADALHARLAEQCADAPTGLRSDAFVRELVADLYADGVDPGAATEVLILAGCGEPTLIVRELVAQGGDTAAPLVVDRAIGVQGDASAATMQQAAADGLARWRLATGLEPARGSFPLAGADMSYSMIYFPLGGNRVGGQPAERSSSLAQLFDNAAPGYGIYTFILYGDVGAGTEPADVATYRELLRVIETYVLAAGGANGADNAAVNRQAHTFLVPVHADTDAGVLAERTGPELSAQMRGDFAAYLRAGGQVELAQRLSRASGPFLVSSLEPRLVPNDPRAPLMLVDLSDIGPEYMYSVVDAYDRLIPAEDVGTVAGLAAIQSRLIDMFPDGAIDAAAAPPPAGGWVYLFGRRQTTGAGAGPAAVARVAAIDSTGSGSSAGGPR
jgi:hypothetical protein